MKINWSKLILSILICLAAGWLGSIFTTAAVQTWYAGINKPSFNPPNWIFAPVWTILFILMGLALYIIMVKGKGPKAKQAQIIFSIQLVLNILWSFCFFYLRSPLAGLIEIVFLWVFILLTIIYFYKISKTAAYLLLPYILWVSFAAFLNFTIWRLN
ncbi:MAG: TspO protein [Candidatus Buchananbacteria bacterium RBG_13_39_9]|uniref:TspO protein n=1 Tax=Candidatus Buchananbacteria bacterium RBG_13_39_9 TaxID=1797531 RepID=A0A1G1XPI6_9BACT|nr:MAG: TspO protein [Candidatus Buchananbacteria bacterium RBG_13_39_9]